MEKSDFSPLPRQALYANKRQWNQFLSIFLLAAGIGFTVTGIIFFFAYNWDELPKFAKLGMVEVLLAASVLLCRIHSVEYARQTGSPYRSNLSDRYAFCRIRANLSDRSRCIPPIPRVDTFYLSLGSSYPFRPVVADIYRTTQYNNMAVCNTNSTRSFVDQRFAHQRSNLDMRHINDRCGANEHKRAVE